MEYTDSDMNDAGRVKRKKVLFIICELYWGGAQKSMLKLINEVAKRHDCVLAVNMVADSFTQKLLFPLIEIDKEGNVNAHGTTVFHKISRLIKRTNFIKRLKKNQNFDVCISFMEGADVINVFSKNKHCKTITSIRGSIKSTVRVNNIFTRINLKIILPFIYKRSDVIVPVSIVLKDELVSLFNIDANKIYPIQNFYNIEMYHQLAAEPMEEKFLPVFKDGKVIISLGRLNLQKNFVNLVRIFALFLKSTTEKYKLVIIGEGEDHDMLCEECKKNNLSVYTYQSGVSPSGDSQVYFLGYSANPHKYVAKADCFLLPSLWEGFPNTFAEALLVGAPSIAADCATGPFEIIAPSPEKTEYQLPAILLPIPVTGQINQQWAAMLKRITGDTALQTALKKNAVARMNDFSTGKIINKWYSLIEENAR
jgi:glycosyltransferase involved in cell wall biosynthesis